MLVEDDVACYDYLVNNRVLDIEDVRRVIANKVANPCPGRKPSGLLYTFLGSPYHRECLAAIRLEVCVIRLFGRGVWVAGSSNSYIEAFV